MDNLPSYQSDNIFQISPVGQIIRDNDHVFIAILPSFRSALKELEHFSHVQIIWWFCEFDNENSRKTTTFEQMPFEAPELGVFACRSPMRPNPLGLSTAKIIKVDHVQGVVELAAIDAYHGTPVIDLKPYLPSHDRVKNVTVAKWAEIWPEWLPENGLDLEA